MIVYVLQKIGKKQLDLCTRRNAEGLRRYVTAHAWSQSSFFNLQSSIHSLECPVVQKSIIIFWDSHTRNIGISYCAAKLVIES